MRWLYLRFAATDVLKIAERAHLASARYRQFYTPIADIVVQNR